MFIIQVYKVILFFVVKVCFIFCLWYYPAAVGFAARPPPLLLAIVSSSRVRFSPLSLSPQIVSPRTLTHHLCQAVDSAFSRKYVRHGGCMCVIIRKRNIYYDGNSRV
jgi:hypothetical protein